MSAADMTALNAVKASVEIADTLSAWSDVAATSPDDLDMLGFATSATADAAYSKSFAHHQMSLNGAGIDLATAPKPDWLAKEAEKTARQIQQQAARIAALKLPPEVAQRRIKAASDEALEMLSRKGQKVAATRAGIAARSAGRFEGYRKIPNSGACGWCVTVAAGRLYNTPNVPRHKYDRCGVGVVTTDDGWNPEAETEALEKDYDRIMRTVRADTTSPPHPFGYGKPANMGRLRMAGKGPGGPLLNIDGSVLAKQPKIPSPAMLEPPPGGPSGAKWGTAEVDSVGRPKGTSVDDMDRIFADQKSRIGPPDDWDQIQWDSGQEGWTELDPHRMALDRYAHGPYQQINGRMRGLDINLSDTYGLTTTAEFQSDLELWQLTEMVDERLDDVIDALGDVMEQHGDIPERIHVIRGDGIPSSMTDAPEKLVGRIVSDPAPLSTAAGKASAGRVFASEATYKITVNPGTTKGIWLEGGFGVSAENELLLAPETRLLVTEVVEDPHRPGKVIIHAETVSDEWMDANGHSIVEWEDDPFAYYDTY